MIPECVFASKRMASSFRRVPPRAFQLLMGGQKLDWGGIAYTRLYGDPASLVGVWDADATDDQVHFRSNGSVTFHGGPGDEYFGTYEISPTNTQITYFELRSILRVTGTLLEFDPPYDPNFTRGYTVYGDVWTLKDPITDATLAEYERVA